METEESYVRFANLAEDDLDEIGEGRNEKSTKNSTKWGVKLLKEWCQAKDYSVDFEDLDVPELATLLRRFYGEARKQDGSPYAIKSYRGLRAALHRHLTGAPYNREINILRDREFQRANNVFLGMLKKLKREGLDMSCSKPAISEGDLRTLFNSDVLSMCNPSSLLNLVWFYLEYNHFCPRGRDGLRTLRKSSFGIGVDDQNKEYVFLNFNLATRNRPGNLQGNFQPPTRMYATGEEKCPVKAMKKYLSKLNPGCEYFFQRPKPFALEYDNVWFENTPIGVNTLGNMMVKISEKANLSKKYTNYSVRATSVTANSNAGIRTPVKMPLTGHRKENGTNSFAQNSQKRTCSQILLGPFTDIGSVQKILFNTKIIKMSASGDSTSGSLRKVIGTHSGTFHCDEALACFMLKKLPEYANAEIVRSRDQTVLDSCDIVVDVGGEYDPSRHRYDHHQRSFTGTMNSLNPATPWKTKLSSAGLVYLHFGERVLKQLMGAPADQNKVSAIYDKVYENFMEEIDAIDNGISQYDGEPRYIISTNISSRVKHLNPDWNETADDINDRFHKAMALVGSEFVDRVMFYSNSWWPARAIVEEALNSRFEVHESGEVLLFKAGGCPWKEHLYTLEKEKGIETPIKYVLYTDQAGKWRVQCVSVSSHSFENRLSLPEKWRGLRDQELSRVADIPGCIFVHASGFIGGNETRSGALAMAAKALSTKAS